jgi:hypothetical protein
VNGELRFGIFSNRQIISKVELTIDYGLENGYHESEKCLCRDKKCRSLLKKVTI